MIRKDYKGRFAAEQAEITPPADGAEALRGIDVAPGVARLIREMRAMMEARGLYDPALDLMIYITACQLYVFNSTMTRLTQGEPVNAQSLITTADGLRKALRELNLTSYKIDVKPADRSPLDEMMERMAGIGPDEGDDTGGKKTKPKSKAKSKEKEPELMGPAPLPEGLSIG